MSKNERRKLWKLMNDKEKPKSNFDKLIEEKEKTRQKKLNKIKQINSTSTINDKRIAESSKKLTEDQKMMLRFKQQAQKATSKYNLILDNDNANEDYGLTHGGKNIDEVEDDFKEQIELSEDEQEKGINLIRIRKRAYQRA